MLCRQKAGALMNRRLRVIIDARMLIGRFSGISRFVTRLAEELAEKGELDVVALCGSEAYEPWAARRNVEVVTSSFGRVHRTADRRLTWEQLHLPRLLRRAKVDLFHATWNTGLPHFCPVPGVLTIHDLIPWGDPDAHFATSRQRLCYRHALRSSCRRAARVTTISDYVRRQVLARLPAEPGRVLTIPNGVDPPLAGQASAEGQTEPYVLYVGGHELRKNVAGVFSAMQRYWERFDDPLELRLTGNITSLPPTALKAYRRLIFPERVRFLGRVDDRELARQYAGAIVLLMLSHDEGFGLPALEAMAHGCPVIAAARTSLPEVVVDAGILVEPDNANQVCEALRSVTTSPTLRAALAQRARQRARGFSWATTASRMLEVYRQVAGQGRGPTPENAENRDGHRPKAIHSQPGKAVRQ